MNLLDALPKLTERMWQRQLVGRGGLAEMFGWRWWHDVATNAPRTCPSCRAPLKLPRNDPGWPDLFLVRGDRLIVAELKIDGKNPTPDQQEWLDALRQVRRVAVVVWKPADVEEVARMLR